MKIGEIHLHVNGILFFKDTQCSLSCYGFGIFGFSVRCIQLGTRRVFPFLLTLVTWFLSLSLSLYFLWSFRLRLLLVYVLIPHYCFLCSRFSCHFIPEWWLLIESWKFAFQRIIQSVCFPSTAALRHWSCLDKHALYARSRAPDRRQCIIPKLQQIHKFFPLFSHLQLSTVSNTCPVTGNEQKCL